MKIFAGPVLALRRLVRAFGPWLLLVPPLLVAGTVIHELAHALAVVVQGGTVLELRVLPSLRGGSLVFGHVSHTGVAHPWWVWTAPALLWIVVATITLLVLARIRSRRVARGLLFALVLLPLVDISFGFSGLFLARSSTDLYRALHGHETLAGLLMNVIFIAIGVLAWRRVRAIAPAASSPVGFTIVYVALLAAPWLVP